MKCSGCGKENSEIVKFCPDCGQKINNPDSSICLDSLPNNHLKVKECVLCKSKISGDAKVCPHCSRAADYDFSKDIGSSFEDKMVFNPVWLFVSIVLCFTIIMLFIGLFLAFFGYRKTIIKDKCYNCGHEDFYEWEYKSGEVPSFLYYVCPKCKKKTAMSMVRT